MKTLILYYSKHHGNTKKLLDAIAEKNDIVLFDVTKNNEIDMNEYDLIGFASGIYMGKFKTSVIKSAKNLPEGKKTFLIYTYGMLREGYTDKIEAAILSRNCTIKGKFGCLGFNTCGPFKFVGGIAKGHPDQNDIDQAVNLYKELIKA